ncbi:MAG: alpha-ribazole phosphatase CobZ [Methanobacteriota archaeon]|nr:MAG: alpha-ribazole phosphatase CobZ [Euryarchaeota archaeon]
MREGIDVLAKHGLTIDDLIETGFELYVSTPGREGEEEGRESLREQLSSHLSDPNVWLMLIAASLLDEMITSSEGDVHGLKDDPAHLVADELIGMCIAEYIAGKRGLFNYIRYDREKPGVIGDLPPFMDDAVGALVAASMTRAFE